MNMVTAAILAGVVGIVIGIVIMTISNKNGLSRAAAESKSILDEANAKADNIVRQATLDGKQQVLDLKQKSEKEIRDEKNKMQQTENKLLRREDTLNFREENLNAKEKKVDERTKVVDDRLQDIDKMQVELQAKIDNQTAVLEKVAGMNQEDAKKELMDIVAKKSEKDIGEYLHEKDEEAEERAADNARSIIANAIQRYAQDETIERTVSAVTLSSEDMKGRIIGREGRNIKAIEQATGVDLIIDDTPDVITVSCFDPIRREIARQSLEILMKDGRIQPGRIEEVVNKVTRELDDSMQKIGEETIFKLGIGRMNKELVKLIGKLRFRYSYGQNALEHSEEVAVFCGIMAAELGLNQSLAKRAGLLHDIGKAVDFEQEGSHVELGAKLAKKYGESPIVINSIESHHGDVPADDIIAQLVAAADTLSAARPGARYESMENYIERLEQLEKIAQSFDGVEKAFAIQAGREVRVMVQPDKVDDIRMVKIAHEIKDRIESEMTYPGQIKVTLIREVRTQEIAQ
ncbi:MAG: ribonuclease Y [Solobacterium sp.]|jgi:ribonuclease Y|nr:ribonuclease Y [Solobacterium sp.]MCH4222238.1 ribonuclease Y [Solobacterium sp.]MCH4265758.1 ribonuclease Y [Solobacterium sp.]